MPLSRFSYPSKCRRTCSVVDLSNSRRDGEIYLCGRLLALNEQTRTGQLRDESGSVPLKWENCDVGPIQVGDIVQVKGEFRTPFFHVRQVTLLAPHREAPVSREERWWQLLHHPGQFQLIRFRSDFLRTVREFFWQQGFLEIDVPALVPAAGMEPHIDPFETELKTRGASPRKMYLHTSPEYMMKKMLVAGYEKIFYLGHAFRNGELAPLHSPEFAMLEWYRAYEDYTLLMNDCRNLTTFLIDKMQKKWRRLWREDDLLSREWQMITLSKLIQTYCQFDLNEIGHGDARKLQEICCSKGLTRVTDAWPLDELFFLLFLEFVEPHLGKLAPTIVKDYPVWLASLAKRKAGDPRFVERFEVYIDGVELANAFTELNDPEEQYQRLAAEQNHRQRLGQAKLPIDEDFLNALRTGMPPSAGIALGVDRLMMVCCQFDRIQPLLPYSFS